MSDASDARIRRAPRRACRGRVALLHARDHLADQQRLDERWRRRRGCSARPRRRACACARRGRGAAARSRARPVVACPSAVRASRVGRRTAGRRRGLRRDRRRAWVYLVRARGLTFDRTSCGRPVCSRRGRSAIACQEKPSVARPAHLHRFGAGELARARSASRRSSASGSRSPAAPIRVVRSSPLIASPLVVA